MRVGGYRCWERVSRKLCAEGFGVTPGRQMVTSPKYEDKECVGVYPAMVTMPRKRTFLFCTQWYLGISSFKVGVERQKMPLFSVSNNFCLIFKLLFGILWIRNLSFSYLSTLLYETDHMLIFTVPEVDLGSGCFSFTWEKVRSENWGSEGLLPPRPRGRKRRIHRATVRVKGYIPHCYRHQDAADMGKGVEMSRQRRGGIRTSLSGQEPAACPDTLDFFYHPDIWFRSHPCVGPAESNFNFDKSGWAFWGLLFLKEKK